MSDNFDKLRALLLNNMSCIELEGILGDPTAIFDTFGDVLRRKISWIDLLLNFVKKKIAK